MRLLAATILCLAAFAGTADAAATTAQLPPTRDFALTFERSGGLEGSMQGLRVIPGGHAVATTSGGRAGEQRVRFRLGARRIRALQRGLARADLASIAGPKGGCADCFLYSLTYEGDSLELEETDVPARLRPVIDTIEAIISAHAIPPNARSARG